MEVANTPHTQQQFEPTLNFQNHHVILDCYSKIIQQCRSKKFCNYWHLYSANKIVRDCALSPDKRDSYPQPQGVIVSYPISRTLGSILSHPGSCNLFKLRTADRNTVDHAWNLCYVYRSNLCLRPPVSFHVNHFTSSLQSSKQLLLV